MKAQINNEREVKFYVLIHPVSKEIRYVGKTVQSLKARLNRHISDGKNHVGKWVASIIKIGLRPVICQIGSCLESENWQEIERLLIAEYRKYGYNLCNICLGGLGASGFKRSEPDKKAISERNSVKIYSKNIETGEITEYNSFASASKDLKIKQGSISECLKKKGQRNGFLFSRDGVFEQNDISKKYRRKVKCLRNNKEQIFDSSNRAGKSLNLDPSFIRKVLAGTYKQYKGFKFSYYE